MFVNQTEEKRK